MGVLGEGLRGFGGPGGDLGDLGRFWAFGGGLGVLGGFWEHFGGICRSRGAFGGSRWGMWLGKDLRVLGGRHGGPGCDRQFLGGSHITLR